MSGAGRGPGLGAALLALCLAAADAGAAGDPAWRTYVRPGEFTDLLADTTGVWGTTRDAGLLRYDYASGTFEAFRREPGVLASNQLVCLARDRSGRLWVGTRASGVSRRTATGSRWEVVNVLDGLPGDSIRVLEAQGDTVWIGTSKGIALWNGREVAGALPDGITVAFDTTFTLPAITGIAVTGDSVWLATRRGVGLARISNGLADWRPVNAGLPAMDVNALASDGAEVFVRVGAQVLRWSGSQWDNEPAPGAVTNLRGDRGTVLAASALGVFRRDAAAAPGWTLVALAVPPLAGTTDDPELAVDGRGTPVASRADTILVRAAPVAPLALHLASEPPPWTPAPAPEGPVDNNLVHVAVGGGAVYMTAPGRGFSRLAGDTWRHWPSASCNGPCDTTFVQPGFALGLFIAPDGRKWVGCWSPPPEAGSFAPGGALTSFDDAVSPPAFRHHVTIPDISQPLDDFRRTWMLVGLGVPGGEHYLGGDTPRKGDIAPSGLDVYQANGDYRQSFSNANSTMSGLFIHGIARTSNGRVWLGYDPGGVDFFVPPAESNGFVHLDWTTGLSVRGLAAHGDSLWALTNTQLVRFDAGGSGSGPPAQVVALPAGQAGLAVQPLATGPDGRVWFATTAGLQTLTPGGAAAAFTTTNSPLPDDEVRAIAVDQQTGVVWLTTPTGLARYDPSYVPPKPPSPPALQIRVHPNPATQTALGIALRLQGNEVIGDVWIHDISGRRVRHFQLGAAAGLVWDGRWDNGDLARPGVYFVRARAGGRAAVARFVLLR